MNYYTFNELANRLGCVTYREVTAGTVTVCRNGRTVGVVYAGVGQVKLTTRFIPPEEAGPIVRLITEFSLEPDPFRYRHYMVRHIGGYWVKEFSEKGHDVKLVLTKNKESAIGKLTATDRERLINHKIGDMFEIVECND